MNLNKKDQDDLRTLHATSSGGPSRQPPRASGSGQSGPWKQDPTPIAIPSNTRGQFQSSRPPGTNPYAAGRLTDTLKSKRDARSRSGNRTTQATILETSKPRPHKRQRVDLNRPGESQNSEASSSRSRPSTSRTNALEPIVVDSDEDTGRVVKRGNLNDYSGDELCIEPDPKEKETESHFWAKSPSSSRKVQPDGASTNRLKDKINDRSNRKNEPIEVDDDPIRNSPPPRFGIENGTVALRSLAFGGTKALSLSVTTKAESTKTQPPELDLNVLQRQNAAAKGKVKDKMKGREPGLRIQPQTPSKVVSTFPKRAIELESGFKDKGKDKQRPSTQDMRWPLETWIKGVTPAPSSVGSWWLFADGDTGFEIRDGVSGKTRQRIGFLDMAHILRSGHSSWDKAPVIVKIKVRARGPRVSTPHEEDPNTFKPGSSGLNGSITLKLRAPKEGEGPGYDALYNLLGQYETETEDLGVPNSKSAWEAVMNGVELARSLQRTVSTSDAVTAPPVNRVPLRRTRTLRSTVLDEPMSAPPRVTRSRQKEVEGSERDLEADRLSPDADKIILVYPFSGTGAVNITKGDLRRLRPGEFLNDTLIEFGLKLWLQSVREHDPLLAEQIHVFNSFFYKKISTRNKEAGYQSVRKWTAKIDLFHKKYIVVPINEHVHWYLAIICNPEYVLLEPPPDQQSSISRPLTRKRRRRVDSPEPEVSESVSAAPKPGTEIVPDSEDEREGNATQQTQRTDDNDDDTAEVEVLLNRSCSIQDEEPSSVAVSDQLQLQYPPDELQEVPMDVDASTTVTPALGSSDSLSTLSRLETSDAVEEPMSPEIPLESSSPTGADGPTPVPPTRFYESSASHRGRREHATADIDLVDPQRGEPPGDEEVVVSNSGEPEPKKTYIFTFDSLGSDHKAVVRTLGKYLQLEAKDKKNLENTSDPMGRQAFVPYQPNYCDCGIYLLHFVQRFMSDPERFMRIVLSKTKKADYPAVDRDRDWGNHQLVGGLRETLTAKIGELSQPWKKIAEEQEAKKKAAAASRVDVTTVDDSDDEVIVASSPKKPTKALRLR